MSLSDSGMYLLMMKEFGPTHEVCIEKPWKHVSKMRSLYANWPSWPLLFFFVAQKSQFLTFKGTSRKPNCLTLKKNIFFKLCINKANSSLTSLPFPRLWRFQWILAKARNQRTDTKDQKVNHGLATWRIIPVKWWRTMVSFHPQEPWGFFPFQMAIHPTGTPEGNQRIRSLQ